MAITVLTTGDVAQKALATLGLPPEKFDFSMDEALAAALRRTASFHCPCSRVDIVRATSETLAGLVDTNKPVDERLAELLDAMISYGDILEIKPKNTARAELLLGPTSFVARADNHTFLLIGIRPDGQPLLGEDLFQNITYRKHTRLITTSNPTLFTATITSEGLTHVDQDQWLNAPRVVTPQALHDSYIKELDYRGENAGSTELEVIGKQGRYYKDRWEVLTAKHTGYFVARRPQTYGAPQLCFVHTSDDRRTRMLDLPKDHWPSSAYDEAFRLQAALDEIAGFPQQVRTTRCNDISHVALDFFFPLPAFLKRRLEIIGNPCPASRGALTSYKLPQEHAAEELAFAAKHLWMVECPGLTQTDHA